MRPLVSSVPFWVRWSADVRVAYFMAVVFGFVGGLNVRHRHHRMARPPGYMFLPRLIRKLPSLFFPHSVSDITLWQGI